MLGIGNISKSLDNVSFVARVETSTLVIDSLGRFNKAVVKNKMSTKELAATLKAMQMVQDTVDN